MVTSGALKKATLLLFLSVLGCTVAAAQGLSFVEVFSDTFDTSSSLNNWTPQSPALVPDPPYGYFWTGTEGSPSPGSLRIVQPTSTINNPPAPALRLMAPCFSLEPGDRWRIRASVFREAALGCQIGLLAFDSADCQGNVFLQNYDDFGIGQWQVEELERQPFVDESASLVSVRAFVSQEGDGSNLDACLFDSVVVERAPGINTIPVLDEVGLVVLCLLLALTGILSMNRWHTTDSECIEQAPPDCGSNRSEDVGIVAPAAIVTILDAGAEVRVTETFSLSVVLRQETQTGGR